MNKSFFSLLTALLALLFLGCSPEKTPEEPQTYEDGQYRGVFIDGSDIQVNIQFTLENDHVTEASFRHLRRDEDYNIDAEEEPWASVIQQYHEALNHLVGKDITEHLEDLYTPEAIVTTEVDGYTSATIRSNKLISAIRDGLNRGVYSY
ncbi:hypothetical protein [Chitinivibrio alkaliphilus]|uniref:FMN-binding domain-containing protein n=1 Tax=Chitinivibrio alkaliphilus ACht1 TaxID=1313304 RepID=U7D574_9BACT|nr:hypothetical protein [Chitinivibrio alkaliphilus]ERP30716.1 hypothetical protein CALK_2459 [Chitinivibrio alkaliphilus ACht1]